MIVAAVTAVATYGLQAHATRDWSGVPLAELGVNLLTIAGAGAIGRGLAGSSQAFWEETPFTSPMSRMWNYLPMHGDNGLNPGWVVQGMVSNLAHNVPGVCTLFGTYEC